MTITLISSSLTPVCFAAGTLIRTAQGDIAIETLRIGDMVITSSGDHRPIKWLGHRTVDCRNHPDRIHAWPIRIAEGSFGPGRPSRDLFVSPSHAICVDLLGELLIPAFALVNGSTITQVKLDFVTYWHVELEDHDIVLANGLPAESYLEMGNRGFFRETDVVVMAARADTSSRTHADFCRPFVGEGPLLDAVRERLLARSAEIRPASRQAI